MHIPTDRSYTKDHEWALSGETFVEIGITDYAQDALGDVVYVQLPQVGTKVARGATIAEVDSTKSVSDIFSPVSGVVVEVNSNLASNPELLNTSPYDNGWIVRIEPAMPLDLEVISHQDYSLLIAV